jgi:hypothetical protein
MGQQWKSVVSKDKYAFVSGDLWVFGYKNKTVCLPQQCWVRVLCTWPFKEELVCGSAWRKGIVGFENFVEEEKYNQFDVIPSFDTPYKLWLLETNKTPYLWGGDSKNNPYTEIKEEKGSLISTESFL